MEEKRMGMGQSAGRAAGSPQRPQARRRMTEDERAQVVALHDDPEAWPDAEDVATYREHMVIWLSCRAATLLITVLCTVAAGRGSNWWVVGAVAAALAYVTLQQCEPERPKIRWWR